MSLHNRLFKNNVSAILSVALLKSDLTLQLNTGQGAAFTLHANQYILATIAEGTKIEIVRITDRNGDILTIQRGQEGTDIQDFTIGASVSIRITAGSMNMMIAHSDLKDSSNPIFDLRNFNLVHVTGELPVNSSPQFIKTNPAGTSFFSCIDQSFMSAMMSTPYSVSTLTGFGLTTLTSGRNIKGFCFNTEGSVFLVIDASTINHEYRLKYYSLSESFNVSTRTLQYTSVILDHQLGESIRGMHITDDGLTLYILDGNFNLIKQFSLDTPWNFSTMTLVESFGHDFTTAPIFSFEKLIRGFSIHNNDSQLSIVQWDQFKQQYIVWLFNKPRKSINSSRFIDAYSFPVDEATKIQAGIHIEKDHLYLSRQASGVSSYYEIRHYNYVN